MSRKELKQKAKKIASEYGFLQYMIERYLSLWGEEETLQFIKEGVIDAVKVQRQREIGYWAIVYLVALNQGHTIPKEHQIGTELITGENL